jgi:hypothetical protein
MVISERDDTMLLATLAPRKWTLRDVQEAAEVRAQIEMVHRFFKEMNMIDVIIVDETEGN